MSDRPVYVNPRTWTNRGLLSHMQDNHEWEYNDEDHGTDPNIFEIHGLIDHTRVADHDHQP